MCVSQVICLLATCGFVAANRPHDAHIGESLALDAHARSHRDHNVTKAHNVAFKAQVNALAQQSYKETSAHEVEKTALSHRDYDTESAARKAQEIALVQTNRTANVAAHKPEEAAPAAPATTGAAATPPAAAGAGATPPETAGALAQEDLVKSKNAEEEEKKDEEKAKEDKEAAKKAQDASHEDTKELNDMVIDMKKELTKVIADGKKHADILKGARDAMKVTAAADDRKDVFDSHKGVTGKGVDSSHNTGKDTGAQTAGHG